MAQAEFPARKRPGRYLEVRVKSGHIEMVERVRFDTARRSVKLAATRAAFFIPVFFRCNASLAAVHTWRRAVPQTVRVEQGMGVRMRPEPVMSDQ
jgi:hypothetical protein